MNTFLKKVTLTAVLMVLVLGVSSSIALAKTVCIYGPPPLGHMVYCYEVQEGNPFGGGGGGGW